MDQKRHAIVMELTERSLTISNHKELSAFVGDLIDGYADDCFEEQSVEDYLEGMEHLLRALDGWFKNNKWGEGAPEQPDWSLMARLLLASFYHS